MLRHCFGAASSICVATQFLSRDSISIGSCCNSVSCIVSIPIATRKVCHDRVLSSLNLISCCDIVYWYSRCLLSRPSFYVATRLFTFSSSLCRNPVLLCHDKTSLPCVRIFVAIWKSLSRPCFFVFSLFLCHDLNIYVATSKLLFNLQYVTKLNSCVTIRSVH